MQNSLDYGRNYMTKDTPLWIKIPFNIAFIIVIIASLLVAIMSCLFIRTDVVGPSMQPTINSSWTYDNPLCDKVLINRLKKGERGDVIVVEKSVELNLNSHVIKRLIAVGGDRITIKQETAVVGGVTKTVYNIYMVPVGSTTIVKVNDEFKDMFQTYTKFHALKSTGKWVYETIEGTEFLVIPDDCVFYLGDNRNHSEDCSSYGPMKAEKVIGKVVLVIPYGKKVFKACWRYYVGCIETWINGQFASAKN